MGKQNRVKIFVLVILMAAIVPPVLFGAPRTVEGVTGGDWLRNTILDFQTLIGGIFAVFAAWWTVDTMEKIDEAAQKRHEQLMRIQSHGDYLVAERMLSGMGAAIRNQIALLLLMEFTEVPATPEAANQLKYQATQMRELSLGIIQAFNDADFDEGRRLLDGYGRRKEALTKEAAQQLAEHLQMVVHMIQQGFFGMRVPRANVEQFSLKLQISEAVRKDLITHAQAFLQALEALTKTLEFPD